MKLDWFAAWYLWLELGPNYLVFPSKVIIQFLWTFSGWLEASLHPGQETKKLSLEEKHCQQIVSYFYYYCCIVCLAISSTSHFICSHSVIIAMSHACSGFILNFAKVERKRFSESWQDDWSKSRWHDLLRPILRLHFRVVLLKMNFYESICWALATKWNF